MGARSGHVTHVPEALVLVFLLLVAVSCQSEEQLSAESTCVDYLTAPYESQVEAVRELGPEAGWQGAVQGQSEFRVAQSCNSPARDPGAVTLAQIFRVLAQVDGDPDPEIVAAEEAGLFGSPNVDGTQLPQFDHEAESDGAVGLRAPDVEGTDFEGLSARFGDTGVRQLVLVTAPWSPVGEMALRELGSDFEVLADDDSISLVLVVTYMSDDRPNWPPDEWLDAVGFPGDVLVDDTSQSIASALGVSVLPFWVLIDETGTVLARSSGIMPSEDLDDFIAEANGR